MVFAPPQLGLAMGTVMTGTTIVAAVGTEVTAAAKEWRQSTAPTASVVIQPVVVGKFE